MIVFRTLVALVWVPALVLAACDAGGPRAADGWAGTVDTLAGGVVLVSNPETGIWNDEGAWRLVEELRIGSALEEGPAMFGYVAAIEVDGDGRIYVADAQAQEIRVFGPDGAHLLSFGRKGGGPGEFEQISGMGWGPDGHLWVMDTRNSRFSVFDRAGRHITDHRRPGGWIMSSWPGGFDDEGNAYDVGMLPDPGADGFPRLGLVRYAWVDGGIEPRDTFAMPQYDGPTFRHEDARGQARIIAGVPFAPSQAWRLGNGRIWIGTSEAYRLHQLHFAGDTLRIVERAFTPAPVSAAELDSVVASMSWFTDQGGRVDRSRIPDRKPAFRGVLEDDSGHLWVWPHLPQGDPEVLDVFDPDGRFLGPVPTGHPVSTTPRPVVRGDRFYAVVRDDLEVQYVVRHRIEGRGHGLVRD